MILEIFIYGLCKFENHYTTFWYVKKLLTRYNQRSGNETYTYTVNTSYGRHAKKFTHSFMVSVHLKITTQLSNIFRNFWREITGEAETKRTPAQWILPTTGMQRNSPQKKILHRWFQSYLRYCCIFKEPEHVKMDETALAITISHHLISLVAFLGHLSNISCDIRNFHWTPQLNIIMSA